MNVSVSSSKISLFEKEENKSLFDSAIDRVSFRSRRNCVQMIPKKKGDNPSKTKDIDEDNENKIAKTIVDNQTKETFKNPTVAESDTPSLPISSSSTYRHGSPALYLNWLQT